MNIDFSAAFEAGMTSEEIIDQLHKAQIEYQKKQEEVDKSSARAEARAYLINAIVAYDEAFNISGEEWDQEDLKDLESVIIEVEKKIPFLLQMYKLKEKMESMGEEDIMRFFQ